MASDINLEGAKDVVTEIESDKGTAVAIQTNVTKEEDIQALIDTCINCVNIPRIR